VTSSLVEHLGYETIYRDSAEAALKLLETGTKVDLVFSDIVMPGTIDGVGLARENPVAVSEFACGPYDGLQRCGKISRPKFKNIT
jgi:CheY-like chemotaxis protein